MDTPALSAIGAFIQPLGKNPGLVQVLTRLGTRTHVYVGTGLGNLGAIGAGAVAPDRAQRRWDRFSAERNPEPAAYRERRRSAAGATGLEAPAGMPPDPEARDPAAADGMAATEEAGEEERLGA